VTDGYIISEGPGMTLFEIRAEQPVWRKSSFCAAGECAELAQQGEMILMRSSLAPHAIVKYTADEFRALRLSFQSGEFDDLG
jgi:hypothetical protein